MSKINQNTTALQEILNTVNTLPDADGELNLQDKTITENGTYTADSGYDGLSKVIVNVASSGSGDSNDVLNAILSGSFSLTSYENSDITKLQNYIFYSRSALASVSFPNVTTINGNAFQYCRALTSVNLPKVEYIYGHVFYECSALETIQLPSSLKILQVYAFYNCTKLTTITIKATTPPTLGSGVFSGCSALTAIRVPSGCGSAYRSATNWSAYADLIVEV